MTLQCIYMHRIVWDLFAGNVWVNLRLCMCASLFLHTSICHTHTCTHTYTSLHGIFPASCKKVLRSYAYASAFIHKYIHTSAQYCMGHFSRESFKRSPVSELWEGIHKRGPYFRPSEQIWCMCVCMSVRMYVCWNRGEGVHKVRP